MSGSASDITVESVVTGWHNDWALLLERQSVVSAQARSKTASLQRAYTLTLTARHSNWQQLSDNPVDIDFFARQIRENRYQLLNQVMERQKQIMLQLGA